MIDYIKFITKVNPSEYELNPLLDFRQAYSTKTGEIDTYKYATSGGFTFKLYDSGLLIVSGSIHKYFNFLQKISAPNQTTPKEIEQGYNGNYFSFHSLVNSLEIFAANYKLNLIHCIIQNIEIGLNITHLYDTDKILNGLLLHKGKVFSRPLDNSFRILEHQRYYLKIYDKGEQYSQPTPTIRIELKYKKMFDLNQLGLNTLNDLKNESLLMELHSLLRCEFAKVLIYDYTIDKSRLNTKQLSKMKDYSNPIFWLNTKPIHRDRNKKALIHLTSQYSNQIQKELIKLMTTKLNSLMTPQTKRVRFNPLDKRLLITQPYKPLSKVD
jgi:hypothetical protein